ncbi:hypothetical protein ACOMHN_025276 [Nucella lapillus]
MTPSRQLPWKLYSSTLHYFRANTSSFCFISALAGVRRKENGGAFTAELLASDNAYTRSVVQHTYNAQDDHLASSVPTSRGLCYLPTAARASPLKEQRGQSSYANERAILLSRHTACCTCFTSQGTEGSEAVCK